MKKYDSIYNPSDRQLICNQFTNDEPISCSNDRLSNFPTTGQLKMAFFENYSETTLCIIHIDISREAGSSNWLETN